MRIALAGVASLLLLAGAGCTPAPPPPDRDEHAQTACTLIAQADHEALMTAVIDDLKAVGEANQSTNASLREAANKTSPASNLDPSNPLYENPGDVQVNAVSAWCDAHPR